MTAPEGALSKPEKVLAGFAKTRELKPGLKEQMRIAIPYESFASYDETGASGFASSYVLEKGEYLFHIGRNVRETEVAGSFTLEETVCLASLSQALALTNQAVAEALDGLPEQKLHCSVLAEQAVRAAVRDYYDRSHIPYDPADFPVYEEE